MALHPSALKCFSILLTTHGIHKQPEKLTHEFAITQQIKITHLIEISNNLGFQATTKYYDSSLILDSHRLFPLMVELNNSEWIVILKYQKNAKEGTFVIISPDSNHPPEHITYQKLISKLSGTIFLLRKSDDIFASSEKFDFNWFLPFIIKQKKRFITIFLTSIVISFITLGIPIFFQVVIDKVLINHASNTLKVLGIGITVALIFDSLFNYLRGYATIHATRTIDGTLLIRTFSHMLSLPVQYFEQTSTGTLAKHMEQSSRIRQFLTGKLFLTFLESLNLFIFVPVLMIYSLKLTGIVIFFNLIIAGVIVMIIIPYRRRINALYDAEAIQESTLIECIKGISVIKCMAMEPIQADGWSDKVAHAVKRRFSVGKITIAVSTFTELLSRLMIVSVIWFGANSVFTGELSVGQLVAFQMLAGRVISPLVQIASLIHHYQEASLSIRKLGIVMNSKPEEGVAKGGIRMPFNDGIGITFEGVSYHYPSETKPAIDHVSLVIPPGKIIGVVGESGSGKTTLSKMIQGHCIPDAGILRINGIDIREHDLPYLRQNMGAVLQESFLFRGTIKENIALSFAGATDEQIETSADFAGAHEFIEKLPEGYLTFLDEGAPNLSGGQKQRIAIARALLTNPRLLIFDEATSSLDPESELIIKTNLQRIARTRTVIIVSHRLSMVQDTDAILVLTEGKIAAYNSHSKLVNRDGLYKTMWDIQNSNMDPQNHF